VQLASAQSTKAYYATAARNLLIYSDLAYALRALTDADVPVIVLKGAALAETVYPSIAHRPMGDADLLVRPEDRDQARAALEAAGYRFLPEPQQRFSPFDTEFTGEMAFRRNDGPLIELHWQLTPAEWLRRLIALDTEALWQDAQPLEIGGVQALHLSPPDTLLHLCLHLTAHSFVHPAGYRDILQLLNHHQPFPWSAFLARASHFRLRTACYFPLEAAASVLGASVPQDVLDALRPPAWQCWLVRRIADPHKGLSGALPYSRPRSYFLHLSVADRPVDVFAVMLWLLFPGRRWLAERYRLQGWLRPWLACLWHPFVILWQGLLGLRGLVRPFG